MKVKHTIFLIAAGYILEVLGAFMKIMHRASADTVFVCSTILILAGIMLLAYKIITYPKFRDFMNW